MSLTSCQGNWDAWLSKDDFGKKEEIRRFDRVVDEFVSLNIFSSLKRMNTEYPHATRFLIEDVLSIGKVHDAYIEQTLRHYYLDSTMQVLLDAVHHEFVSMKEEEEELFFVFHQLEKVDPHFVIPIVYTQVSGLNQSVVVGDSVLGISLDKYLGIDFPLYKSYYYDYQRELMGRDRLVPDALYFYLQQHYSLPEDASHTLMDYILRYAKFQWILAKYRGVSIEEQSGFNKERQLQCIEMEQEVWNWMLKCNYLNTTNLNLIKELMYARETRVNDDVLLPSRIGIWFGIRIFDSYMKKHPKLSIGELLYMNDFRAIYEASGYVPTKK